jgi:hypothetical protein
VVPFPFSAYLFRGGRREGDSEGERHDVTKIGNRSDFTSIVFRLLFLLT